MPKNPGVTPTPTTTTTKVLEYAGCLRRQLLPELHPGLNPDVHSDYSALISVYPKPYLAIRHRAKQSRAPTPQIVEKTLTGEDYDETDVQAAPKLMEVVLQNCKGRVDQVVGPYLALALRRLPAAETSYMKVRAPRFRRVGHCA